MKQRSDAAAPAGRTGGIGSDRGSTKRTRPRFLSWLAGCCGVAVSLVVAYATYAVLFPQRVPQQVGALVEDLSGANPHPVRLVRPPHAPLGAIAMLGEQIFFDPSLSASGRQSCASCHRPDHAYGPDNAQPVQLGGPHMTTPGYRAPPSLAYLYRQANFSIGPDANDLDIAPDLAVLASQAKGVARAQKSASAAPATAAMVPQGGFFWDGRADTLQDQALGPMLNPAEMANANEADVARKLLRAPYIGQFKALFGANIVNNPDLLIAEAMSAVARYQFDDQSFHRFTSKYDYWLEGRTRLTRAELHGMRLFNDSTKANCAGCHLSQPTRDGLPPLFTDTQYEALGVPRNAAIPANKDPKYFDLGLCGPFRRDLAQQTQYCGMFLTPTLRNVGTRHVFFHNGVYHDLKQVMDFYNLRNISPERIYPRDASGKVAQFDDIPAQYRKNVDFQDAPFDRKRGDQFAMSDRDIRDIIAFMNTLTDGYRP